MAALVLPSLLRQQPQTVSRIDPKWVDAGLLRLYHPLGGTIVDASGAGGGWTLNNSKPDPGALGIGVVHNANSSSTTNAKTSERGWQSAIADKLTFFVLLEPVSRNASDFVFGSIPATSASTATYNFGLYWGASGPQAFVRNAANAAPSTASAAFTVGKPQLWLATYDGANIRFYLDGVFKASIAQTGNVSANAVDLSFGGWVAAGVRTKTYLAGIANKAWTDAQIADFAANPWQAFKAPTRRLWIAANDAGTTHTLSAASSSQDNQSSSGTVQQTHLLAGAASTQSNAATSAAVTQTHVLAGSTSTQANTSSSGTITLAGALVGSPSNQANSSSSGTILQTHVLAGSNATQANSSSAGTITILLEPRYARPAADLSAGPWLPSSGNSLAAVLDEDDGDYIEATSPGTCRLQLNPVADPHTSAGQVVRYRCWSATQSGLTVRLKQGAQVIGEWLHDSLPVDPTTFAQTLTAAQCDAITDYGALSFEFVAA